MTKTRNIAILIAGLTTASAILLLVDRGGLIAWSALFIGLALLAKVLFKPTTHDLALSAASATALVLVWFGTLYYVISTFESGEVVELAIETSNGTQTARVWVLDIGAHPLVYYDTDPEVAMSLLAGTPLQFTRSGNRSTRIPEATPFDELPEDEANLIFEAMGSKYGERNGAVDVFYSMLGRPRDRIAVVASLRED